MRFELIPFFKIVCFVLANAFVIAGLRGEPAERSPIFDYIDNLIQRAGRADTISYRIDPELGHPEAFHLRREGSLVRVSAGGPAGALYGVKESLSPHSVVGVEGRPDFDLRGAVLMMLSASWAYQSDLSPEAYPWFFDRALMTRYLDYLLSARLNTLVLWSGHLFPHILELPEYPDASQFSREEIRRNQEQFRWLAAECARRNITILTHFYNIHISEHQAKALVESGVNGAFICGTTGEGLSLTTAERGQIAEKWMSAAPRSLHIIVHVGHQSANESKELAAHAQRIGAAAFATIAPTFFRAANLDQLVDYCASVAEAAPNLPFYYYHMPAMTGADFSMHEFLKLASQRIPNLAGIKFTHENLMDYTRCLNFDEGRFNILFGRDEILLAALAIGATGAVGSTYNYMASIYHRMLEAFNSGDIENARRYQFTAIQIIAVMSRRGGLAAGKAMMKMVGLDCGPVRAPLQNLSPEALESLIRELEHGGFPSLASKTSARTKSSAIEAIG